MKKREFNQKFTEFIFNGVNFLLHFKKRQNSVNLSQNSTQKTKD